jgi:hypothetical protein
MTANREEEWAVEKIIDERKHGHGYQYLVKWIGYGDEENRWLSRQELINCEVLDRWEEVNTADKMVSNCMPGKPTPYQGTSHGLAISLTVSIHCA